MKEVTTIPNYIFWTFLVVSFATAQATRAAEDEKCFSKLNSLRTELTAYQQSSRRWATAWGITWTAATVSQLTIAATIHDNETRKDLWVGSASAALGLVPTWIIAPEATRDFEFKGDCEDELSQAEALVKRLFTDTEVYNGTTAQVANVAGNLITSLILGLGFGHWGAAAISFGAGVPLGEVMILTFPKQVGEPHNATSATIVPSPAGPALAISFEF
jgi:hypothetical protein